VIFTILTRPTKLVKQNCKRLIALAPGHEPATLSKVPLCSLPRGRHGSRGGADGGPEDDPVPETSPEEEEAGRPINQLSIKYLETRKL